MPLAPDLRCNIVLSFFDGIGSGPFVLQELLPTTPLVLAWETDQVCKDIASHHMPHIQHRGDFREDSPEDVAAALRQHAGNVAPQVWVLAGPPCPDFSRIKSAAPGIEGSEGVKMDEFCTFLDNLEGALKDWPPPIILVENVVMTNKQEIQHFSHRLRCNPILVDAADFGMIGRPRLWWTRHQWSSKDTYPGTNRPLRWSQTHGLHRLQASLTWDDPKAMELHDLFFHEQVRQHQVRIPCLTTPAPTSHGRPAPRSARGKTSDEARERWIGDQRRFAPWNYEDTAMMQGADRRFYVVPPKVKERLHHFPDNYTKHKSANTQDRHRVLGNSWHLGVARLLLTLIFTSITATTATQPSRYPHQTILDQMIQWANVQQIPMGPGPRPVQAPLVTPCHSMEEHFRLSSSVLHPAAQPPEPEPSLQDTARRLLRCLDHIDQIRQAVLQDLQQLKDDWAPATEQWLAAAPPHIRQVYTSNGSHPTTQVPLICHLLRQLQYPEVDELSDELHGGFRLLGDLPIGAGWSHRHDLRYSCPTSVDEFLQENQEYIYRKLLDHKVEDTMLDELLKERDQGKILGPFASFTDWPKQCVGVPDRTDVTLLPNSWTHCPTAVCFSVVQSDKIRRCEDYRRGHHNSTIGATDIPHHHDIGAYVSMASWFQAQSHPAHIWAHDLKSAYRQFPIQEPWHGFTLLFTPHGPTLWQHQALMFGATASVWGFNRAADAATYLTRQLLLTCTMHYVDDFGGVEPARCSTSGFQAFTQFTEILGLHMKPNKAQPPDTKQELLGVEIEVGTDEIVLRPTATRQAKLREEIHRLQAQGTISPAEASRLAGRMTFLNSTVFGKVGAAALRPLYVRAKAMGGRPKGDQYAVTPPLAAALRTMIHIISTAEPQRFPLTPAQPCSATLYADAFYKQGEYKMTADEAWELRHGGLSNGWGFVARLGEDIFYAHGSLPQQLLLRVTTRQAFIYFLEIYAQVVMTACLSELLPRQWISFIDNQAGHAALLKGWGSDERVNLLLECFWKMAAKLQWQPHFEWVPSHNNISDPISRGDFSLANLHQWTLIDVEDTPLHKLLSSSQTNLEQAHLEGDRILSQLASTRCCVVNSPGGLHRSSSPVRPGRK